MACFVKQSSTQFELSDLKIHSQLLLKRRTSGATPGVCSVLYKLQKHSHAFTVMWRQKEQSQCKKRKLYAELKWMFLIPSIKNMKSQFETVSHSAQHFINELTQQKRNLDWIVQVCKSSTGKEFVSRLQEKDAARSQHGFCRISPLQLAQIQTLLSTFVCVSARSQSS